MLKIINHKKKFPPRGDNFAKITEDMLKEITASKPKFAFVIEWPNNGDEPVVHTSTEDAAVIAFRLQNILNILYSKENPLILD